VEASSNGDVAPGGPCVELAPRVGRATLDVTAPVGGVAVRPRGAKAVEVRLRRFASAFPNGASATVQGRPAVIAIPADRERQQWHVQVAASEPVAVCGAGARRSG
jgi:hypothetical protein